MKRTRKLLAVVLGAAGLLALAAAPALCSDEFCPMGGTLIMAEADKDKAIGWGKDRSKSVVAGEETDSWSVLVLAKSEDDIAVRVTPDAVYFGVAGRGGRELDARDLEKVYGKDLRKLREAVKKEMGELWKAGAVKIEGSDVQGLSDATGLGTLVKGRREWELKTQDCTVTDLDASGL
jgi:hypothetical protein